MRWLLIALLMAGPAQAETKPVPRPASQVEVMAAGPGADPAPHPAVPASPRPAARTEAEARRDRQMAEQLRAAWPQVDPDGRVRRSGRPLLRDAAAIPAPTLVMGRPRTQSGAGLCGRGSIRGERIPPVTGAGACGIPDPVRITSVSGIGLSRPARMDCRTAQALDDWVRNGVIPVVGRRGGGAVALQVAAGYSCRTRNNQAGAKVSEHGLGRAIDISGIRLASGEVLTVLGDWNSSDAGRIMRELHRRACGPFGTVLGPDSDRFHRDHFHFDTARYRSGSYCR